MRKELKVHNCPLCGELTAGTISEGGIHFSVCEECYEGRYQGKEEEGKNSSISSLKKRRENVNSKLAL